MKKTRTLIGWFLFTVALEAHASTVLERCKEALTAQGHPQVNITLKGEGHSQTSVLESQVARAQGGAIFLGVEGSHRAEKQKIQPMFDSRLGATYEVAPQGPIFGVEEPLSMAIANLALIFVQVEMALQKGILPSDRTYLTGPEGRSLWLAFRSLLQRLPHLYNRRPDYAATTTAKSFSGNLSEFQNVIRECALDTIDQFNLAFPSLAHWTASTAGMIRRKDFAQFDDYQVRSSLLRDMFMALNLLEFICEQPDGRTFEISAGNLHVPVMEKILKSELGEFEGVILVAVPSRNLSVPVKAAIQLHLSSPPPPFPVDYSWRPDRR